MLVVAVGVIVEEDLGDGIISGASEDISGARCVMGVHLLRPARVLLAP